MGFMKECYTNYGEGNFIRIVETLCNKTYSEGLKERFEALYRALDIVPYGSCNLFDGVFKTFPLAEASDGMKAFYGFIYKYISWIYAHTNDPDERDEEFEELVKDAAQLYFDVLKESKNPNAVMAMIDSAFLSTIDGRID